VTGDAGFTIRAYRDTDNAVLAALWLDACEKVHGFLGAQVLQRQQALVAEHYLPGSETWVAVSGGAQLGFIGLLDDFIGGLFVDPGAQRQGVGRALVDFAQTLKGQLWLDVYEANAAARGFYARLGFEQTGRRAQDDLANPYPLIRLTRTR